MSTRADEGARRRRAKRERAVVGRASEEERIEKDILLRMVLLHGLVRVDPCPNVEDTDVSRVTL